MHHCKIFFQWVTTSDWTHPNIFTVPDNLIKTGKLFLALIYFWRIGAFYDKFSVLSRRFVIFLYLSGRLSHLLVFFWVIIHKPSAFQPHLPLPSTHRFHSIHPINCFTLSDWPTGSCSEKRDPAEAGHNRTVSTGTAVIKAPNTYNVFTSLCTFMPLLKGAYWSHAWCHLEIPHTSHGSSTYHL